MNSIIEMKQGVMWRLRLGAGALGSLAHRLAELADQLLETRVAVFVQLRLDRPVLRP